MYVFQRKRKEWEFWWVLLVCIKLAFLKTPRRFFWLCPITSTLKIIMDLTDFLSQTSTLSYFNVLGSADFMMYQ